MIRSFRVHMACNTHALPTPLPSKHIQGVFKKKKMLAYKWHDICGIDTHFHETVLDILGGILF